MTEQTLSDKIFIQENKAGREVIMSKDVKDFIKKLKEEILNSPCGDEAGIDINRFIICGKNGIIDKLAGSKLTGADLQEKKQ